MDYGSTSNLFGAGGTSAKPEPPKVGDGATIFLWTDRYAGTVTRVETSKSGAVTVYVREDTVTWKPHPSGYAESYAPGDGPEVPVKLRYGKTKGYRWVNSRGLVVKFGYRDAYSDPHF